MATSSLLGGAELPDPVIGKDTDALGPSDNSDSGSDAQGAYGDDELHSDSDAAGTGERATIGSGRERSGGDILPDHLERESGAATDAELDEIDGDLSLDSADVEGLAADDGDEDGETGEDDEPDAA